MERREKKQVQESKLKHSNLRGQGSIQWEIVILTPKASKAPYWTSEVDNYNYKKSTLACMCPPHPIPQFMYEKCDPYNATVIGDVTFGKMSSPEAWPS